MALSATGWVGSGISSSEILIGVFAGDPRDMVAENNSLLGFLGGPPVAIVLSSSDILQTMPVLALSVLGRMGFAGGDSQLLLGLLADDALKSVSEEKLVLPTLGGPPLTGFLSANDISAKRPGLTLSAPVGRDRSRGGNNKLR